VSDILVPVNTRWKIRGALKAAGAHAPDRYSIESAMIRSVSVNDQPWRPDLFGQLLSGRLAHVKLIRPRPTPGSK
jgi:23S rRNA (adenine2503-C2)-methyltransferase